MTNRLPHENTARAATGRVYAGLVGAGGGPGGDPGRAAGPQAPPRTARGGGLTPKAPFGELLRGIASNRG